MEITYDEYLKSIGETKKENWRPTFDSVYVRCNFLLDNCSGFINPSRSYYYIRLADTPALCQIAEDMREEAGYEGLIWNDDYTHEDYNYDFYIEFHATGEIKMSFIPEAYGLCDNGEEYYILLDEEEQDVIFRHFKKQIERDDNLLLERNPFGITFHEM